MASRVQKIKLWDTFKNAKSVILHFFPVAEIGRNIHLLYFSYPQQIYSQFVEWGKKVLSPYSPQWSVYFSVLVLLITRKHPVVIYQPPHNYWVGTYLTRRLRDGVGVHLARGAHCSWPCPTRGRRSPCWRRWWLWSGLGNGQPYVIWKTWCHLIIIGSNVCTWNTKIGTWNCNENGCLSGAESRSE